MANLEGDGSGGYLYDGLPMPPRLTKTGVDALWQSWGELVKATTYTVPTLVRRLALAVVRRNGG